MKIPPPKVKVKKPTSTYMKCKRVVLRTINYMYVILCVGQVVYTLLTTIGFRL